MDEVIVLCLWFVCVLLVAGFSLIINLNTDTAYLKFMSWFILLGNFVLSLFILILIAGEVGEVIR